MARPRSPAGSVHLRSLRTICASTRGGRADTCFPRVEAGVDAQAAGARASRPLLGLGARVARAPPRSTVLVSAAASLDRGRPRAGLRGCVARRDRPRRGIHRGGTGRSAPHRGQPPPSRRRRTPRPIDRHHLAVGVAGGENEAAGACWLSAGKGLVWVVADPAGRTSAPEPKATEARPRRGVELEAMIETRGAQPG